VTNDLVVEGAEVGRDRLLHEEGKGFTVAMATLDGGRIGIAAQALGIAQAAYDAAREYAKERRTFGKAIAEHQAIQFKLADMATKVDAARLLTMKAARLKDAGQNWNQQEISKIYDGATQILRARPLYREMDTLTDPGEKRRRRAELRVEFPAADAWYVYQKAASKELRRPRGSRGA
jgi:alkylation response protein AidB-like acyl-CoA dehydrogenase